MTGMDERIETAFEDELLRMRHEGVSKLVQMPLDVLFWQVYRRGYIRGHSARSREVQQAEEQDRREGRFPMDVEIKWQGDRLIVDGKDRTPPRPGETATWGSEAGPQRSRPAGQPRGSSVRGPQDPLSPPAAPTEEVAP